MDDSHLVLDVEASNTGGLLCILHSGQEFSDVPTHARTYLRTVRAIWAGPPKPVSASQMSGTLGLIDVSIEAVSTWKGETSARSNMTAGVKHAKSSWEANPLYLKFSKLKFFDAREDRSTYRSGKPRREAVTPAPRWHMRW